MDKESSNYGKHIRIWVSGIIAGVVFVVLMHVFDNEGLSVTEALFQGVIFYASWIIIHYIFFNKLKY